MTSKPDTTAVVSQAETTFLRNIRRALAIQTHDLPREEVNVVRQLANELSSRMTCEEWGIRHGWSFLPEYGTEEWERMQEAWLSSEDE